MARGEEVVKSFCLVEENTFSGGGHIVNFEQLVEWLGLPHLADGNRQEAAAPAGTGAG